MRGGVELYVSPLVEGYPWNTSHKFVMSEFILSGFFTLFVKSTNERIWEFWSFSDKKAIFMKTKPKIKNNYDCSYQRSLTQ